MNSAILEELWSLYHYGTGLNVLTLQALHTGTFFTWLSATPA
jgi:hypothetical protein